MAVVGNQATVLHTGKTGKVRDFSDEVEKIDSVPIVVSAVDYDCHKTLKNYLQILKNALHIPFMQHNLIPPFIMQEAGLEMSEDEVTRENHSIMIPHVDLRIPLRIGGVLFYFESRYLTDKEIEECETMDTVLVTPDSKVWGQHCDSYAEQEEKILGFRG